MENKNWYESAGDSTCSQREKENFPCFNCCFSAIYGGTWDSIAHLNIKCSANHRDLLFSYLGAAYRSKSAIPQVDLMNAVFYRAAGNSCSKIVNREDRERKKENNNLTTAPLRDLYRREQRSFSLFSIVFSIWRNGRRAWATRTPPLVFFYNSLKMVRQERVSAPLLKQLQLQPDVTIDDWFCNRAGWHGPRNHRQAERPAWLPPEIGEADGRANR